jgi:hypothetical protein
MMHGARFTVCMAAPSSHANSPNGQIQLIEVKCAIYTPLRTRLAPMVESLPAKPSAPDFKIAEIFRY